MGIDKRISALENRADEQDKIIKGLNETLRHRYPTPVLDTAIDIALVESIFDILSRKRIDPKTNQETQIATQEEINHYLDMYPAFWGAIINILIDRGITTQKELDCEILAYHFMVRTEGLNTGKTKEELFEIRREYAKELMQRKNPYEMIGR